MRALVVAVVVAGCGRLRFDDRLDATITSSDATIDATPVACGARIGAGRSHFCATTRSGLYCWGLGTLGQLGDGLSASHTTPTLVPIAAVFANGGRDETCAVKADGTVWCWGENASGQLGNNSTAGSPTPIETSPLPSANEVWPAAVHSCARAGGSIWCWGDGSSGRLGTGNNNPSLVPVQVPTISTAIAMSAAGSNTCAILADHSLLCWGYNVDGQIGNNTTTDQATPIAPIGIAGATAVSMRDLSTCAVRAGDGAVMCWGRNDFGQVGDGNTNTPVLVPTAVRTATGLLAGADEIASGIQHVCARLGTQLYCWGDNAYGQLGQPLSTTTSAFALPVPSLPPVAHVSLSGYTTCIVDTSGLIHCWGYGNDGQLGNGTNASSQVTPVLALDACM